MKRDTPIIDTRMIDYHDPQQAADLINLLSQYANDPMGGAEDLTHEVKQNLVPCLATLPHAFSIITYVDNQPAGLSNCLMGFSTFAAKPLINIHDLAVSPAFRGLGISYKLLDKIEQIAQERGCCKITLEVLQGNHTAKKVYLNAGFAAYEIDPSMGHAMFWQKKL